MHTLSWPLDRTVSFDSHDAPARQVLCYTQGIEVVVSSTDPVLSCVLQDLHSGGAVVDDQNV